MTAHQLDIFIWTASPIGELLLLFVLFARHRAASFPIFTTYLAFDVITTSVLIYVGFHCRRPTYWYTYCALDTLCQFIQLLVAYEICMHVFRPTGVWAPDVRKTLISISSGGILFAVLLASLSHPSVPGPTTAWMRRIDLFYSILMSELFVGMLTLASTVGLPWKTHTARIAQGFGATSLYYLLRDMVCNYVSLPRLKHIYPALDRIGSCFGIAFLLYWIVMLWRDAPAPQELPERLRQQIYTLNRQVEHDLARIRSWKSS